MESYHDDNENDNNDDGFGWPEYVLASSGPHVFFLLLFFYIYRSHS